jgi:hypothetical protein
MAGQQGPGGIWWNVATPASAVTHTVCRDASEIAVATALDPTLPTRVIPPRPRRTMRPGRADRQTSTRTTTGSCCAVRARPRPVRRGPASPGGPIRASQVSQDSQPGSRRACRRMAVPVTARRQGPGRAAVPPAARTAGTRTAGTRTARTRMAGTRTARTRMAGTRTAAIPMAGRTGRGRTAGQRVPPGRTRPGRIPAGRTADRRTEERRTEERRTEERRTEASLTGRTGP